MVQEESFSDFWPKNWQTAHIFKPVRGEAFLSAIQMPTRLVDWLQSRMPFFSCLCFFVVALSISEGPL